MGVSFEPYCLLSPDVLPIEMYRHVKLRDNVSPDVLLIEMYRHVDMEVFKMAKAIARVSIM